VPVRVGSPRVHAAQLLRRRIPALGHPCAQAATGEEPVGGAAHAVHVRLVALVLGARRGEEREATAAEAAAAVQDHRRAR